MDLASLTTRIIVKRKEVRQIGRIIVPDGTREMQATEGTILDVGPNVKTLEPGDEVFFGRYSGAEIERDGEKYIIMNEEDVLCIIKKPVAA